ncbi:hypothetical protein B0O99DRAFT_677626 [Bisporella sp. PMI_857]|nr:hypothetical protein B0O99DRAFT_677626 [Bisporella sp. PMI_857]
MRANNSKRIQFVSSCYPGNAMSTEMQRKVHSHAARTAHFKARRLCMIEYQASKTRQTPEPSKVLEERGISPSDLLSTVDVVETEKPVLPSPVSLLNSDRKDPFNVLARSLGPIEHFLLDHYIRAVIPCMSNNCNELRNSAKFRDLMTREWAPLTLANIGSLSGAFLSACRHLLKYQQQEQQREYYVHLASQYKLASVRALREAISFEASSLISDSTVSIVMLLAYDELILCDFSTAKSHLQGLIQMMEHNGGPQTLGSNGVLERLVYKFVGDTVSVCNIVLKPCL